MKNIIEVSGFTKSYQVVKTAKTAKASKAIKALNNISFSVREGQLFSFLGPNGAGKSTTINTLCTLLAFEEGDIRIDGYNLKNDSVAIRNSIGVVFQESLLDDILSVKENLAVRAGLYTADAKKRNQLITDVQQDIDLSDILHRLYGKLSGGQKRRADIAASLIHKPKILFLDEPTTGLDPQTRLTIWQTVKRLQQERGMTIFLTTHYMEEAAESDYIVIIDHGQIVAKGTPAELKTRYATDKLHLETLCAGKKTFALDNTLQALEILADYAGDVKSFQVIQGSMDDVFINITGKEIR